MIQRIIDALAANPKIFIFLRKILENNFKTQKEVVIKYLSPGQSEPILDIGCGTGEFSVFFKPENYVGVDVEKRYIDFARKNYQGKFLLDDATRLSFPDNSFLKILIVGVLHHLDDAKSAEVLAEAERALAKSGKILILEDVNSPQNGVLTNLIHRLDKGKFIRDAEGYEDLLSPHFKVMKNFGIKSGLGAYQVFLLQKKDE